jgi:hypothetical protein
MVGELKLGSVISMLEAGLRGWSGAAVNEGGMASLGGAGGGSES